MSEELHYEVPHLRPDLARSIRGSGRHLETVTTAQLNSFTFGSDRVVLYSESTAGARRGDDPRPRAHNLLGIDHLTGGKCEPVKQRIIDPLQECICDLIYCVQCDLDYGMLLRRTCSN